MLDAATDVFIEKGYAATSLDDVIARAGGSRRTLYERFGSKEGLFEAVVRHLIEGIIGRLHAIEFEDLPAETGLNVAGRTFLGAVFEPRVVAAFRMMVGELGDFPHLGAAFYDAGPKAAYARLAAYLRARTTAGELEVEDPDRAARILMEMFKGDLHLRALLGIGDLPSSAEIERHVEQAVHLFIEGARARG